MYNIYIYIKKNKKYNKTNKKRKLVIMKNIDDNYQKNFVVFFLSFFAFFPMTFLGHHTIVTLHVLLKYFHNNQV